MLEIHPPGDHTPESWASRWDSTPSMLSVWPESRNMTLVVVKAPLEKQRNLGETQGYVLTSRADVDRLLRDGSECVCLFFSLPRSAVLAEGICPGLTAESWE